MSTFLRPFDYLTLNRAEPLVQQRVALLSMAVWAVLDFLHWFYVDVTIAFFAVGGVLDRVGPVLAVLVGVFFGLAGVFRSSTQASLDKPISPVFYMANGNRMTRRQFSILALTYCAAMSALLVFVSAVLAPFGGAVASLVPTAYENVVRAWLSICASSIAVGAITHVVLVSLLNTRMLSVGEPRPFGLTPPNAGPLDEESEL